MVADVADFANQSGRAALFAVAHFLTRSLQFAPDAEVLALGLAEVVLANKLNDRDKLPCCCLNVLVQPFARSADEAVSGRANGLSKSDLFVFGRWRRCCAPRVRNR
ncbi:DUF1403 family protein [Agrobacterium sp. ICMP 6402]|nr:DUF1403 family protein [Agrobacterium sp. ICMP 6402]